LIPPNRDGVAFLPVHFHVLSGKRPVPGSLNNRLRTGIRQDDSRFIIHSRIDIRLDLLRNGCHRIRPAAIHQPGRQIGAVTAKVKERASAI